MDGIKLKRQATSCGTTTREQSTFFFKDDQVSGVAAALNGPGNPRHPISMRLENPPPEEE